MHYNVKNVRPLNKHCVLITVDNEYDRDSILAGTPLYLGGNHMVFALPWEAIFNPSDITSSKVPVWVEFPHIHLGAESFGRHMLQQVGSIVHYDEENQCRHHSVKGCVLLDLQEDLPETMEIEDEDTGASYHQKIVYRNFPDACLRCHQRGHIIRNCSLKRLPEQQTRLGGRPNRKEKAPRKSRGQTKSEVDAEGFTTVKGGRSAGTQAPSRKTTNMFEVMHVEESESDQSEDESEDPQPVTSQVQSADAPHNMDLERNHGATPEITQHSQQQTSGLDGSGDLDLQSADPVAMDASKDKRKRSMDGQEGKPSSSKGGNTTHAKPTVAKGADDYTEEGKAGAAVVLPNKNWTVTEKGVKGDGYLAWMIVETEDGPLGLASVYGPRDRNQHKRTWEWMENKWPKGRRVLGGDWNSVETPADSVGSSPIQLGGERRKWQSLIAHHDLEDGWLVASKQEGPHFTKQQTVVGRIDQVCLDRVYFNRVSNGRTYRSLQHTTQEDVCRIINR
ncbi:hypothetical protein R1sor_007232 [Riccia sorocarpa]|uniref:CCHC-type domain-containing protein n=1 Tax=Riccia sorocarpa TaxID=122646 RepID=A0ABD3HU14_9MARC